MQGKNSEKNEYKKFKQIANIFYNEELEILDGNQETYTKLLNTVDIEPRIIFDKFTGNMKIEFSIGNNKKYKIKDLSEFYNKMINKEYYRYSEKMQFVHTKEIFNDKSKKIVDFILKYAETIKIANANTNGNFKYYGNMLDTSRLTIGYSGIDDIFEILKGDEVEFQQDNITEKVKFIDNNPKIEFILNKKHENEYTITPNVEIFKIRIIRGREYKYILKKDKLYKCTKEFEKTNLKLLEVFRQNYITEVELGEAELKDLFSIVLPKVKEAIKIQNMNKEEIEKYKPKELVSKLFLDFDKNGYLLADIKFCYENNEFNPLNEKIKKDYPRNIIKETQNLNMFKKAGFKIDLKNLRFVLTEDEKIFEFISNDINKYMQRFEILGTKNFKTKQIREPKIENIGIKVENGLLEINLNNLNIDAEEIQKILLKYKEKKKYYRLKSGEFIDLIDNKEIEFIEKLSTGMEIKYEELKEGKIEVPVYRSLYLNQLLKEIKSTQIIKNTQFKDLVKDLNKENIEEEIYVPDNLEKTLRYYQKTGFKWLKILDKYKFGGILADDMGLGKTVQMLSIIVDYVTNYENDPNVISGQEEIMPSKKRASLVISPSSLCLNWQNESKKFTSELKTLVIRGDMNERKAQIQQMDNYDLVITSYDLLKRDIEVYKEINYKFRFIIADEAQYLKNSTTQNAKTIKEIKADTRYALTGTPIENTLAELWSIFDFIMPGYLFKYKQFKANYETPIVKEESTKAMEKLKMLIQPFILRRTKAEVLTELPEKVITVLDNEMKKEQENVYLSYLSKAKQDIAEEIDINGYKRSQMKILAALTRLRQICCHPSLFLNEYNEGSSKLEQCMEIISDATSSGHKILLFSSYTSMFEIIEKELQEKEIKYFKLTGSTKVEDRLDLVDEFNENPKIQVFLISLKAGGTGLNLTGADVVIHYDPWWNISAENQATDRAYRIGQKNNVQVYKLITKNTIEEKIYNLQQRKAELIDNMLDTKTVFVNKMSRAEILDLFN